ncbi:hypothetical protein CBS147333_2979 [Penicillium roqueforti]|uniref:uncharacterized protein n=1 Tax=Penicillium roqueforti TaxID=5082 RepID=UPI00190AC05A|nr:uncharacterized protein LCP9604111_296 [Penicillium roqueforti]KAF9252770.1 hypothetical protein LCP9604111_296 [Penicillium roqueforti]KAI2675333.1 hypothetical protein CBS147355_6327 [Penicillium roqueforti]KAI2679189.1 hypothetical protein LCP963914a_7288 [Penicillium roqueforti]KAI2721051.1 hypothetical protein CBS147354_5733 [Penicillium roqueforti]KAI2724217.1 hypothetical protein CBS147318_1148 [Penicillium roqueforti]
MSPTPEESNQNSEKQPPAEFWEQPRLPRPPPTNEQRAAALARVLDPNDPLYRPSQAKNVATVIELYQNGTITVNDEVFVVDGRVASQEECIAAKKPYFCERGNRTSQQCVQKASYGHGPYIHGH